ncbi:MAG: polyprenyl synthetase family protein [Atopobiaceae bacterium]|nr:polyprenyl synthetase family protein [Atopobiaceae bacterium]
MTQSTTTHKSPFSAFLERVLPSIEHAVAQSLPKAADDAHASDLEQYLYEPLARLVRAGGKRIRPALCLLGSTAVGGQAEDALSTACAVELFQAAALIHDDIADQSELRRGLPCLHISEGTGIAINAGDMGVIDVVAQVMRDRGLSADVRLRLFDELYAMERRTLEGQALDLGWVRDGRWDLREEDYLAMATLKTAHYSAASPLVLGAICGKGTQEQVAALRAFGLAAGLAFQIQDDLLNLVGDAEKQGKDFRSDVTEGKRTLVMVRALRQLGEADAAELQSILSSHSANDDARARAVELAEEAGAITYAQAYAQSLADEAKRHVNDAPITDEAREILLSMADFFVSRAS